MKRTILFATTIPLAPIIFWANIAAADVVSADHSPQYEFEPNDAPCGERTIANITTPENDVYVFCAGRDGDVVVIAHEDQSSSSSSSKGSSTSSPADSMTLRTRSRAASRARSHRAASFAAFS